MRGYDHINQEVASLYGDLLLKIDAIYEPILDNILQELSLRYPRRRISYLAGMGTQIITIEPKSRVNFVFCSPCLAWVTGHIEGENKHELNESHPLAKADLFIYSTESIYPHNSCLCLSDRTFLNGVKLK